MGSSYIQHKHLLLRAECKRFPGNTEQEQNQLNADIEDLISLIGMKTILPARCYYVGADGNEGWTGQAGLETSHIAYHIWNKPDPKIMSNEDASLIQLDVYTCGCLGEKQIKDIIRFINKFGIIKVEFEVIDRAKSFKREKRVEIPRFDKVNLDNIIFYIED